MLHPFLLLACLLVSQIANALPATDAAKVLPRATAVIDCPIYLYTYAFVSGPTRLRVSKLPSGAASLSATGVGSSYGYTSSSTGDYFSVTPRCPAVTTTSYLTVDELYPASYKPLVWTSTKYTNYWIVSGGGAVSLAARAPQGGSLHTAATSPFGVKSSFLACGSDNQLYLQTGSDTPAEVKCQSVYLSIEIYA